ncbi:unnamed protein product [Hymenolepis diminuta]|uniref:Uncharacterized protein n=1 Tax=Hymenolepis diminuta TaxID=6216 RepID=A0A564YB40_HYMDI|nr:unnamed protein product [Hymenolepis diminuta]
MSRGKLLEATMRIQFLLKYLGPQDGKGHRISPAPVRQMPASGKEPHSPTSCAMVTGGSPMGRVLITLTTCGTVIGAL